MKCVSCGSTNLVEGDVLQTPKYNFKFHPGGSSLKDRMFGHGRQIHAYGCLHCNHLQFTVDFEPGDLERYQEFEGTQPPMIERLEGGLEERGDE